MIGARALIPYRRPFPVWRRYEVELNRFRWYPDWCGVREVGRVS